VVVIQAFYRHAPRRSNLDVPDQLHEPAFGRYHPRMVMRFQIHLRTAFYCYRGSKPGFVLLEPEEFAVEDAAGRNWTCFPVPRHIVELADLANLEHVDDRIGDAIGRRLVFCESAAELTEKLAPQA